MSGADTNSIIWINNSSYTRYCNNKNIEMIIDTSPSQP